MALLSLKNLTVDRLFADARTESAKISLGQNRKGFMYVCQKLLMFLVLAKSCGQALKGNATLGPYHMFDHRQAVKYKISPKKSTQLV